MNNTPKAAIRNFRVNGNVAIPQMVKRVPVEIRDHVACIVWWDYCEIVPNPGRLTAELQPYLSARRDWYAPACRDALAAALKPFGYTNEQIKRRLNPRKA
jgi:hypothetical protein